MTTQIPDILNFDDQRYWMSSYLLEPWLKAHRVVLSDVLGSSCLLRGYQAHWLINADELHLTEVKDENLENSILKQLFPKSNGSVFADWVSGEFNAWQDDGCRLVFCYEMGKVQK